MNGWVWDLLKQYLKNNEYVKRDSEQKMV